jgi:Rps23 Pro-64 3,4-dihydroxylase Tpa1-like proline 4-hydroxylase
MNSDGHNFVFDDPNYPLLAKRLADKFKTAVPFPHVIIDDFLPKECAERLLGEFPAPNHESWHQYKKATELKWVSEYEHLFGSFTRSMLYEFNSATFLKILTELTGVKALISDPYFRGGGMHQIEPGGMLKIHVDFNKHSFLNLHRRLNLLLYLNKDWKDEYGGHLELWDAKMEKCHQRIAPIFNRCVIFLTSDVSPHGHPDPLRCPAGMTRKSLALYYYSASAEAEAAEGKHSTLFKPRPGENF